MSADLFDRSAEYDAMLQRGLDLTGESKGYYIAGRLEHLERRLPGDFKPARVLDFGCGIGDGTRALAELFPDAEVVGVDTAERALQRAQQRYGDDRVSFAAVEALVGLDKFDLCFCNGVLHHIEPPLRAEALARVRAALLPRGLFALYENNPYNPGTRLVMRAIPFDRDAVPIAAGAARRLLGDNGFDLVDAPRFLFYFPRALRALRFLEPRLERLPAGGQYGLLARVRK